MLSVAAFTRFAFVDTFGSYNNIRSCVDSLIDSDINYISVSKSVKVGSEPDDWWAPISELSEEDIRDITDQTGNPVAGIYSPGDSMESMSFASQFDPSCFISENYSNRFILQDMYCVNLMNFCGFAEITEQDIKNMGYSIYAGQIPDGSKNEIAISLMACDTFIKAGYMEIDRSLEEMLNDDSAIQTYLKGETPYMEISSPEEMIGKTLFLNGVKYTITGIIDTKHDTSRYERIVQDTDKKSNAEILLDNILFMEYQNNTMHSLTGAAMVGKGKVSQIISKEPKIYSGLFSWIYVTNSVQNGIGYRTNKFSKLSEIPESDIIWFDGKKETLNDNEVIVSLDRISIIDGMAARGKAIPDTDSEFTDEYIQKVKSLISSFKNIRAELHLGPESFDLPDETIDDIKIVGCFKGDSVYSKNDVSVFSDNVIDKVVKYSDGIYHSAVGCMPQTRDKIDEFVRFCYRDGEDVSMKYELNNAVTYELGLVDSTLKALSRIFFYIGIFFAVFASILMANFISTSISYKRQEIGILRAIGSRSNDVFRIFFSESFIIAMINFVISSVLCFAGTLIINYVIRNGLSVYVTVLHFGIRQVLILLLISISVAFLASFIPVKRIASRKPIDAIRGR